MRLSVLLTTIGRPVVGRALTGLVNQAWEPGDEIMVVSDDNHGELSSLVGRLEPTLPVVKIRHIPIAGGPHRDWGHTPRNLTMHMSRADYICHFDDDDVPLPTMVQDIHVKLRKKPEGVHLFRMIDFKSKRLVWRQKDVVKRRFVSTQNIVHPNARGTFGNWGSYYGGDAQFIMQTAGYYPGRVHFQNVVTCVYAPPPHLPYEEITSWYRELSAAPDFAGDWDRDTTAGKS